MTICVLQTFVGALTKKEVRETSALSCLFYKRNAKAF
jgi:hypothetical protein